MGACGSAPQVQTKAMPTSPRAHAERFETIRDRFESIEEVQEALRGAGLESSEVIVAVDFTKSNEQTGARSFGGAILLEVKTMYRVFSSLLWHVLGFVGGSRWYSLCQRYCCCPEHVIC